MRDRIKTDAAPILKISRILRSLGWGFLDLIT